jgi:dolichol-phosphate mannosyltransferase
VSVTLYAVAPLFNEEDNVASLMASLSELGDAIAGEFALHVVLVDDGSSDGTFDRLHAEPFSFPRVILQHPGNLGPGTAFATGFSWLAGKVRPDDWVLTLEGEATSSPETIRHMLTRRHEGFDVVLASPYMYGGGFTRVSLTRILISQVANSLVKLRLRIRGILTFSCFLRLYRGTAFIRLQECYGPSIVRTPGFEAMVELLGKIVLLRLTVSEVAARVDGSARRGKSKMKIMKTAAGYCRLFLRWKTLSQADRWLR